MQSFETESHAASRLVVGAVSWNDHLNTHLPNSRLEDQETKRCHWWLWRERSAFWSGNWYPSSCTVWLVSFSLRNKHVGYVHICFRRVSFRRSSSSWSQLLRGHPRSIAPYIWPFSNVACDHQLLLEQVLKLFKCSIVSKLVPETIRSHLCTGLCWLRRTINLCHGHEINYFQPPLARACLLPNSFHTRNQ